MHRSQLKNKNVRNRTATAPRESASKPKKNTSLLISLCLLVIILSLFGGLSMFSPEDGGLTDEAAASASAL